MYEINGICYAGSDSQEIRVTNFKPLTGGILLITFSTGEQRLLDTTKITGKAFEPLKDFTIASNPTIFHGILTWQNGEIDISPEETYSISYPYNQEDIISA